MRALVFGISLSSLALGCETGPAPSEEQGPPYHPGTGSGAMDSGGRTSSSGAGSTSLTPTAGAATGGRAEGATGGSPATGGTSTAGGSGGAGSDPGTPVDPAFKLLWRDDFDSFDGNRWTKATHTFEENLARFAADNAVVEGGLLKLRVTRAQNGDRPYSAAEVYSKAELHYGRFEGRIKFCAGSGMVSSLFTYKDDVNTSWQEIDVEHLGYLPRSIQYNLISGNLANRVYQPKVVTFPYSPAADFHDYAFEWKPDGITFFVDGVQTHQATQASIRDAARLRMNVWPTNNAVTSFAGPLDTNAIPCEAQYDWVAAYAYEP